MDHAQNLKKMFKKLGKKILKELLSLYTKQKVKQTLRKQGNSSSIMSSQSPLTMEPQHSTIATSSQDTTEKIIMEKTTEPVLLIRDWSIDRIHKLSDSLKEQDHLNAIAISEEFNEWINIEGNSQEISYFAIEDDTWTDEQEIDIR
jgi:hypothetical protein